MPNMRNDAVPNAVTVLMVCVDVQQHVKKKKKN